MLMIALMNIPSRLSFPGKKKNEEWEKAIAYKVEFTLFANDRIKIKLTEDEQDAGLMELNCFWNKSVYLGDEYLFRASVQPFIGELQNKILGNFYKEVPGGILLQLLEEKTDRVDSHLIFLSFQTLECSLLGDIGLYQLYTEKQSADTIRGINQHEQIEIAITQTQ